MVVFQTRKFFFHRQCSECDSSESDDSDANEGVDTNAPRKLRESHQIKLPAKFTPPPKETKKVYMYCTKDVVLLNGSSSRLVQNST